MKAIGIILLTAVIASPCLSFAWGPRRGVVVVRPYAHGAVAAGFVGGVATGVVLNRVLVPRPVFYPGSYGYYYPPSYVYTPYPYPPLYSYYYSVPPPPLASGSAYDRGYSEGYSRGYEQARRERERERYEDGKKHGYEQGYDAGRGDQSP